MTVIRTSRDPVELPPSVASTARSLGPMEDRPKNIIIFVTDGLGFAHLSLARAVGPGIRGEATWDRFQAYGWHQAHPVQGLLTDSAASATALATGRETRYGALGIGPDGESLVSLFELAHGKGHRLGVVTDSYVWDATPAAFVAESESRENAGHILEQLARSELEVLFGELEDVGEDEVPEWEPTIELLQTRFVLLDETLRGPPGSEPPTPVAAIFEEDAIGDLESKPTLPEMVAEALARLSSDERPFLMLLESEEPDSASHDNDLDRLLRGMKAIEAALSEVLDFSRVDGQTLVILVSDHETGGLALTISDNTNRNLKALWASKDHTGTVVPVMAYGPGAEHFAGTHTTAQLGQLLAQLLAP
ncbi:MAG: alkaline phosphatase [bacterium]|nr:alkaline phosphatase [bacterium]